MAVQELLADYGYLAVFIGSLLEGEVVLVLAGFAAHRGYLSLPAVMAVAFCGGTLGDQLFFFAGRRWGRTLLRLLPPGIGHSVLRVNTLLLRFDAWLIVGVRFMYGLRIAGPIVIGMSAVPAMRFMRFNVLGAAIWAVLVAGAGYLFGETLQRFFAPGAHFEAIGAALILALVGVMFVVHRLLARRKRSRLSRLP